MELKSLIQLVLGYLGVRMRSRKELGEYLVGKTSNPELVEAAIAYLDLHKLIDDEEFARAWTESRLRKHKGDLCIHQELTQKGIEESVIHSTLSLISKKVWFESINATLDKYRKKLTGLEGYPRKTKIYAILSGRGFSSSRIDAFLRSKVE